MGCSRCGADRLCYEFVLTKRFPSGQTMERTWLLCQSCIADIVDFIDRRKRGDRK